MENILKDGDYVIAPEVVKNPFVTSRKSYEVFNVEKIGDSFWFKFIDDEGLLSNGALNNCQYLNGQNWLTKPSLKQQLTELRKQYPNDLEFGSEVAKLLNDE